jgi:hypothetical protein
VGFARSGSWLVSYTTVITVTRAPRAPQRAKQKGRLQGGEGDGRWYCCYTPRPAVCAAVCVVPVCRVFRVPSIYPHLQDHRCFARQDPGRGAAVLCCAGLSGQAACAGPTRHMPGIDTSSQIELAV